MITGKELLVNYYSCLSVHIGIGMSHPGPARGKVHPVLVLPIGGGGGGVVWPGGVHPVLVLPGGGYSLS